MTGKTSEIRKIREKVTVRLNSKVEAQKIKISENFDENECKYFCPVCFQYLNNILVGSCCGNYICLTCFTKMGERAIKDINYKLRCVHCQSDYFILEDVDKKDVLREYTDTPT